VATDISPEMVAVASRRATAAGLDNIQFLEVDAEDLRFENESFDAATNAYGLMFCPDPTRAVREVRRVLRPGGRFAFVTWDEPARNPFFTVIGGVAARCLSLTPPDPAGPGPFRFAPPGKLEAELRRGGFA
jgi:ubiquinone/menaquinone biosynthesis C-methylase UbiE